MPPRDMGASAVTPVRWPAQAAATTTIGSKDLRMIRHSR